MGFLIYCDNKGCGKSQEPLLDIASGQVYCTECDRTITNVTSFAKIQMQSLGQIKKDKPLKSAFVSDCPTCEKKTRPVLNGQNIVECSVCHTNLAATLSQPFIQMLKTQLRS